MENENLFSDFPPVSDKEWRSRVEKDLKGKDFKETLIWNTTEGFELLPFYRKSDITDIKTPPGEKPYRRGTKKLNNNWEVKDDINLKGDSAKDRSQINKSIASGADALGLKGSLVKPAESLKNINFEETSLYFYPTDKNYSSLYEALFNVLSETQQLKGCLNYDPIGYLTKTGNWLKNKKDDFQALSRLINSNKEKPGYFRVLNVSGDTFRNAGGGIVHELAFSLAQANEYLNFLSKEGFEIDDITANLQFTLATGTSYFPEIAKFRALRVLWTAITDQYKAKHDCSSATFIHAVTSKWHSTLRDPQNNTLRATTETMSSVIGGCDCLTVIPFNSSYEEATPFSRRLAKNVQIVLREEAYLDKVADPAGGSYYVEQITNKLCENAWDLFLEIESKGGFLKCLSDGIIQEYIGNAAKVKIDKLRNAEDVLVGSNKYVNEEEETPLVRKSQATEDGNKIINPLKPYFAFEFLSEDETIR